jgi:hypothetical protein
MAILGGLRSQASIIYNVPTKLVGDAVETNPNTDNVNYVMEPPVNGHDRMIKVTQISSSGFVKEMANSKTSEYTLSNTTPYPTFTGGAVESSGWGMFQTIDMNVYPANPIEMGIGFEFTSGTRTSEVRCVVYTKNDDTVYARVESPSDKIEGSYIKSPEVVVVTGTAALLATGNVPLFIRSTILNGAIMFEVSFRANVDTDRRIIPTFLIDAPIVKNNSFKHKIFYRKASTLADSFPFASFNFFTYGMARSILTPVFDTIDGYQYQYQTDLEGETDSTFDNGAGIFKYYRFFNKIEYRTRDNVKIRKKSLQLITDHAHAYINIDGRVRLVKPNTRHVIALLGSMTEIGIGCLGGNPNLLITTEELKP